MCKLNNLYKGKYFIVFYDKTDEHLMYMFNNVREILDALGRKHTKNNIHVINTILYRSLKSEEHFSTLFGECMRVYIIEDN